MRVGASSASPSVAVDAESNGAQQIGMRDVEDAPDQRKAVRMRSARREPDQAIAGDDVAAVDDGVLFHDAHGEAGEIVRVPRKRARMLGRLAADQRAARQLASFGDAFDHVRARRRRRARSQTK